MATWFSRLGRAVAVTVAVYAVITVGFYLLAVTAFRGPDAEKLAMEALSSGREMSR